MAKKKATTSPSKSAAQSQKTSSLVSSNHVVVAVVGIGIALTSLAIKHRKTDPSVTSKKREDEVFLDAVKAWDGNLIDRVPYDEMSHERFFEDYQRKRKPVVIAGMYADSPLTEGVDEKHWGWKAMRDRFGDVLLENRVERSLSEKGCTGTGLCQGEPIKLRDLLNGHFLDTEGDYDSQQENIHAPYPHDIELKKFLPDMFDAYRKSSLFAENLLLPIKNGKDRWPSLFFGATGTRTNLHTDSMGTSFTMAVFRGRKQFLLFDAKDGENLCMERPNVGLDYGVGEDPFHPDFIHCPEATKAKAFFADVRAGDLLFLPGHVHHAARNLVHSVGISQNFLTVNDFHAVLEDFGGYVAKLRRKRNKETQPSVGIDFLSIRDLFKLLAETDFRSNWLLDPPFWNADDATEESYERIKAHVTEVLEDNPMQYATRLAYFSNFEFAILSLKAYKAWNCLGIQGKEELLKYANGTEDIPGNENVLDSVGKSLGTYPRTPACRDLLGMYLDEVLNVRIPPAVSTIDRELGLTNYCC